MLNFKPMPHDDEVHDDELDWPTGVILLCQNCGERHMFESLDAASLAESFVNCDSCGKPFIRPALDRLHAFLEMVKTNPATAKKLVMNPLWLEAFLRGKKIPGFEIKSGKGNRHG